MSNKTVELIAPLSGLFVPIEAVPDPVFSQKMVGDGVSIDPTSNVLLAPAAGKITQLASTYHALTLTTVDGLQVLLHIGLDTVMLKGEGFRPLVKEGDTVTLGQPLIEFNESVITAAGKSSMTEIVIANGDIVTNLQAARGFAHAGKTVALTVTLAGSAAAADVAAAPTGNLSDAIRVPNPTGLHARPAAVLANMAKTFKSDVKIVRGSEEANAKSVVSIMGLEVQNNDEIKIKATGVDAAEAIKALVDLVRSGSGEDCGAAASPAAAPKPVAVPRPAPKAHSDDPNVLLGVSASPGLAVGQIFQVRQEVIEVREAGDNPQLERRRLEDALKEARQQLEGLKAEISDASKAEIFSAHQELLADPELLDLALSAVSAGKSAPFAWKQAFTTYADKLAKLKNELLAGRANDIRDIGRRVLRLLTGVKEAALEVPDNAILIAEELTPSDTASLDRNKVLGFATTGGGATSHVAILARSLNIPAICGIEEAVLELANGTNVILDGTKGSLRKNPSESEIQDIRTRQASLAKKRAEELAAAGQPAVTTDGVHIEVVANIGGLEDAQQSVTLGGEGVGLLRSEFLYLERTDAPTEEEQTQIYGDIAKALGTERTLVIRTLDVGGDKPLPYLPMPAEENPFLGVRVAFCVLPRIASCTSCSR